MHMTKMGGPFVDISIVLMIQSTLVSGLLCLSLPVLGTVQGTVRGSRLLSRCSSTFSGKNVLYRCFFSPSESNICPPSTWNVIITYFSTLYQRIPVQIYSKMISPGLRPIFLTYLIRGEEPFSGKYQRRYSFVL